MLDKLKIAEERYEEINEKLMEPDVVSDQEQYKKLMKEYKTLTPLVEKYREYKKAVSDYDEARNMLNEGGLDKDFKEMVQLQYEENKELIEKYTELYRENNDVYPFAIYNDEEPVGFMMLDEDLEERCLVIWRIMFPAEHQNKGYGTAAIREIIRLAKESGKYDFMILGSHTISFAVQIKKYLDAFQFMG